jgi:hypothetical protein
MATVMFIGGIIFFIIGFFAILKAFDEKDKRVLWMAAIVVGYCVTIFSLIVEDKITRKFAKDVNARQVSIQGENVFRAQVQITYQDGKLKSVNLVPETTLPEPEKVEIIDNRKKEEVK